MHGGIMVERCVVVDGAEKNEWPREGAKSLTLLKFIKRQASIFPHVPTLVPSGRRKELCPKQCNEVWLTAFFRYCIVVVSWMQTGQLKCRI